LPRIENDREKAEKVVLNHASADWPGVTKGNTFYGSPQSIFWHSVAARHQLQPCC